MKKKMLLMMLALTVSVALIVGATMSWFTNEAETANAVFQAGTVEITAEGATALGDKGIGNVNPGDCYVLEWDITNTGTKAIELRTILEGSWSDDLDLDNIFIVPHPSTNWVLYQDDEEKGPVAPIYAYYMGGPVAANPDDDEEIDNTVKLRLVVYFDGDLTINEYQAATFTFGGGVEAVQASNGAPSAVWGEEGWDTVTGEDYSFDYEGWLNIEPEDIDCYNYDFNEQEPDPSPTPDPEPEMGSLYSYNEDIDITHDNSGPPQNRKTRIAIDFTDAEDENGILFTGEQQFELRYRISNYYGSYQYATETITVQFTDGEAEFEKEISRNYFISEETTTVTMID